MSITQLQTSLSPYEAWMVRSNLRTIEESGASGVDQVALLERNGYPKVAAAVSQALWQVGGGAGIAAPRVDWRDETLRAKQMTTLSGEPLEDRGIILEAGKRYRTKNGALVRVTWIIERAGSASKLLLDHPAYCDRVEAGKGRAVSTSYALNGKWCIYKDRLKSTAADYDIIEEIH